MAASLIQSKTGFLDSTTTSQTVTFDNPATSGNMLILFCSADKGPGTFSIPSGWTQLQTDAGTAQGNGGVLAYKVAAGGETAVAVSWSASGTSRPTMAILEYSGLSAPTASNKATSGDTAVTSIAVGSVTTPAGNSFVLAFAANDSVSTVGTTSWGSSFTQIISAGSGGTPRVSIATNTYTSSTTVNPVWTFDTNPGDQAMGMIAVFPEGTPPAAATAGDEDGMIILQSAKALGDDSFTDSMNISLPSLTQINNLLFLVVGADKDPVSVTLPSGFTAIQTNISGGNAGGVIAYKVSTGSEQSFTVGFGSSTVSKPTLFLFECAGFPTSSPVDVSSQTNSVAANVSSIAAGQITLTTASSTVFAVAVTDSPPSGWVGTRTWSDGFTEVEAGGRGSSATVSIAKQSFSSTGTVNTTFSWTPDAGSEGTDQAATFLVAFKHNGNTYEEPIPSYSGATEVQSFAGPRQAASTSSSIKLPRLPKSGNLLVVSLSTGSTPGTITPPAGFTLIKSITDDPNVGGAMAYKISNGTEQVLEFTWINSASSALTVLEYGGMHATPLGGYNISTTASATSLATGPIITTTDNGIIIASLFGDGGGTGRLSAHSWSNFFFTKAVGYDTSSSFANAITATGFVGAADVNTSTTYSYTGTAQPMATIAVEFASDIGTAPTPTDYSTVGKVATPTFSPTAGTFTDEQLVTLSTTTAGATIYYTLDGSEPTTASSVYSTELTVSATTTIKAFATAADLVDSDVATGVFTINLPTQAPFNIVQQGVASNNNLAVTSLTVSLPSPATAGNTILLVLGIDKDPGNVSDPSGFTLIETYEGDVNQLSVNGQVWYKVATGGEQNFAITWANANRPTFYAIECSGLGAFGVSGKSTSVETDVSSLATATVSPTEDSIAFVVAVTDSLNDAVSSWTNSFTEIYNSNNGTSGSGNAGVAFAYKEVSAGSVDSTFSRTVEADQAITFIWTFARTTSSGAAPITLVGSNTAHSSDVPVTSMSVSLPAPATAGNLILLALGMDKDPGTVTLPSGFTTEQFYLQSSSSGYVLWKIAAGGEQTFNVSWTTADRPTFAVYEYSGLGGINVSTKNTSVETTVSTLGTGTVTTTTACRAFAIAMIDTYDNGDGSRSWSNDYTELTWAGNVGNTGLSVAYKDVPAGSTSSTFTFPTADQVITFLLAFEGGSGTTPTTVATPTFSPTAGSYSSAQSVSISCSTPSSTIYYTTDGSTPTTGSTVYSTPITVSSSMTIKAIAAASGMSNSAVAEAIYTIGASGSVTQVRSVKALATAALDATVTATFGSACASGNLIVLVASLDKAQSAYTLPSGFTMIQEHLNDAEGNGVIAYKISDGTETSFTVTSTGSTGSTPTLIVTEYSGTHATSPIGASAKNHLASGTTGSSFDCGTITTTVDNAYVVAAAYADTSRTEWSSASFTNSFTKVDDTNANNVPPGIAALAYGYKANQPTSTSVTTVYGTIATAEGGGGFIVEIIPSGESGGTVGGTLVQSKVAFNTSSATSVSATLDQATTSGNVLLVWCGVDKDYSGLTLPTGFTAIQTVTTSASRLGGFAAYKVADGTETTISVSWTNGTTASRGSLIVHEYSGFIDTTFVSGQTSTGDTAAQSLATATITTPGTAAKVFAFSAMDSVNASATSWINDRTWSNGYTEASFTPQTVSNDAYPALSVAVKTVAASDSEGPTFGWSTGVDQFFTIIFAVEVESSGGPTKVATPTFSPAAGNFGATQNVTISCSTPSSTIYYTLDGSTPTTASSVFSTPLEISVTTTIKAFATADGLDDSNVATASYNIGVGTPNVSVSWQVAGGVTSTGGTILLGISASASMLLKIYEMPSNTLVQTTEAVATNTYGSHHVARIVVTGLTPNTKYKYLPNDGAGDILAAEGYLHTFPDGPGSFKFCHWSCNNAVNNARYVTIKNKAPLTGPFIGLNIGDLHYLDTNSTTESNYYQAMVDSYSSSNGSQMYKVIAFDRMWDDHDFSGNDSNYDSIGKAASAAAFRKFTPHYPLPAETGHSVFHSFVCGRMRFIVMDTRSEKDPGVQHISTQQLNFVKAEILAAKLSGQVVCLVSPGAWIGSGNNDADLWPGSTESRAQRLEIATWIRQLQMNRSIFLISGDAHMLAADDGTNNTYGFGGGVNFRVFHAAGLSQNGSYKGGPYTYNGTTSNFQSNSASGEANGQHATVTVTDTGGSSITINWVGSYGAADTVWRDYTFTLDVPKTAKARVILV